MCVHACELLLCQSMVCVCTCLYVGLCGACEGLYKCMCLSVCVCALGTSMCACVHM